MSTSAGGDEQINDRITMLPHKQKRVPASRLLTREREGAREGERVREGESERESERERERE